MNARGHSGPPIPSDLSVSAHAQSTYAEDTILLEQLHQSDNYGHCVNGLGELRLTKISDKEKKQLESQNMCLI